MREKFINEEERKKAVIAGATPDKDGFCGCPRCGSFRLTLDGSSYDNTYIMCNDCNFSISGFYNEEFISRWNNLNRSGNKKYL